MTAPDRVELLVPPDRLAVGDLLVEHDDAEVRQVIPDAVPEFVYAFAPEQVPLPRNVLVRVRRVPPPAPEQATAPPAIDPDEYAAVRDLALALADLQPPTGKAAAPIRDAAAKVRGRKR